MNNIKIIVNICIVIALYYASYYLYNGLLNPVPALGDSWDYHIPIEKSILNGSFINPANFTTKQYVAQLNPGSSEAFNSLFLLLHIPLTISNLFAAIVLFFCLWKLGLTFKLKNSFALLFALSFFTLNVIVRWFNAVSIDMWIGVFFCLALILLEQPQKSWSFFAKLGFVLGMLVGSKYSGITLSLILLFIYGKSLIKTVSFTRIIAFLIPFSLFGLFWYVRNYLAVGNPIWPFCIFSFPCKGLYYNSHVLMWDATIKYPLVMANAFFSEYKLWSLSLLLPVFAFIQLLRKKISFSSKIVLLCIIGAINFIFFLKYPTSYEPWVMVSSFRYSYPIFIPLMLGIFLLAEKYKKEEFLGYLVIANMLPVLTMSYYPKLVLVYFPIALVLVYLLNKKFLRVKPKQLKA